MDGFEDEERLGHAFVAVYHVIALQTRLALHSYVSSYALTIPQPGTATVPKCVGQKQRSLERYHEVAVQLRKCVIVLFRLPVNKVGERLRIHDGAGVRR